MSGVVDDRLQLTGVTLEGKYRIEAAVAEGGFALVYRATHLVWKRPVAVKVFYALADLPESQRAALLAEFLREGALLAELSERSAAIVQARDVGTLKTPSGEQVPFMILEWLDGTTLENVLRSEREKGLPLRSPQEAIALLEPVAEALALAHNRGIAHRDVKPPNIFILGNPRAPSCGVKLLDFGIAKVVQDAQKMGGSFAKTSGDVTSFTPAYGAPEQFSRTHGATGPWTDVFALALVASEVMTGKAPLDGDSFVQLGFAAADTSRRPTPRTLGAACSDEVEKVFAKALAVPIAARYQSAGELWNALREALAMSPMRLPQDAPTSAPAQGNSTTAAFAATAVAPDASTTKPAAAKSRTPLVALIGVAALAAVAFAATKIVSRTSMAAPTASATASMAPMASASPSGRCPDGALFIEGGSFFMGANDPPPGNENEKPAHPVMLSPFCIDRFEVTTARYYECSKTGKCLRASTTNEPKFDAPAQAAAYDPLCNANDATGKAQHPINCVDWDQADRFCKKSDGRLPTESEWEFAARGPDGRVYPWGDEPPSATRANACGSECIAWAKEHGVSGDFPQPMYDASDGFATTSPVGSFSAGKSRYGVEDVVGNVWEWTADEYAPYTSDIATTQNNPTGPATGTERVIRGGSWNAAFPAWARPTFRFKAPATNRSYGIGFRCVYAPR